MQRCKGNKKLVHGGHVLEVEYSQRRLLDAEYVK